MQDVAKMEKVLEAKDAELAAVQEEYQKKKAEVCGFGWGVGGSCVP
jgi:hypothetical protein